MTKLVIKESEIRNLVRTEINRIINEGGYKKYHVNMEYPQSKPHLTAKKLSNDELKDKLTKLWNNSIEDKEPPNDLQELFEGLVVSARYRNNPKLKEFNKDLNDVEFDWENYDSVGDIRDYEGVKYLMYKIGGDWELPVAVFVYFDGKTLRAYVPIRGNAINIKAGKKHNTKIAFGNNDEEDAEFCKSEGIEDYMNAINYVEYNEDVVIKDFHSALKIVK